MKNIIILDYGLGNLGSIKKMLKKVGFKSEIAFDADDIKGATHLIIPGVGSFDAGMRLINESGLRPVIEYLALEKKIPILGICLGMQLLTKSSSEGKVSGLGWVDAEVIKFPDSDLKVPHMGWNYLDVKEPGESYFSKDKVKFYFVHSYYVKCFNETEIMATASYGFNFCASFKKNNIYGVQFHPEKSHHYGISFFKAFFSIHP